MAEKSIPGIGSDAQSRLDLLSHLCGQPVQQSPVAHNRVLLLLQERPDFVYYDLGADLRLRLREEQVCLSALLLLMLLLKLLFMLLFLLLFRFLLLFL